MTCIPKVNLDFVSYSSYDTEHNPTDLRKALDYLESKLPTKDGIAGKRVFIGEYGFPAERFTPEQQDAKVARGDAQRASTGAAR